MTILEQLSEFVLKNSTSVIAAQFRGVLEGNNIPYKEGWEGESDDDEYIFSINEEPDTFFLFDNDDDGEFLAIAEFEKD